jgi:hypothetical protein
MPEDSPTRPHVGPETIAPEYALPVPVLAEVPYECTPALEAYERCISMQWPGEVLKRFGYFEFEFGRSTLSRRRSSLLGRTAFKISDFLDRQAERAMNTVQYSPLNARYFLRESLVPNPADASTEMFLSQLTYLRSIQLRVQGRPTINTYPPSPISNLVVAVLPGRIIDELGCSLGQTNVEFSGHTNSPRNANLREGLNRRVLPALKDLWVQDRDVVNGEWLPRGTNQGLSSRASIVRDGEDSLEPLFSSRLFQSGLFDPAAWQVHSGRGPSKRARPKDFCMVLTPYGRKTIVVLQYPTSTTFNRAGEIEQSRLGLDAVGRILKAAISLIAVPSSTAEPPSSHEIHAYFHARMTNHYLPVPAFEAAVRYAEVT